LTDWNAYIHFCDYQQALADMRSDEQLNNH